MDTVSDRGSVAINSPASVSVPVQAGSMAQRHGSPADSTVVAGCSPAVHIDLASAFPLAGASGAAGQGRGSLSGRITELTRRHFGRPPRSVSFASTLET